MHTRINKTISAIEVGPFELKSFAKHVAYLFHRNKLIAVSTNKWGQHAEIGLIPHILSYNDGRTTFKVYVRRVDANSQMSRPCYRCSLALKHFTHFVRIFYTNEVGEWIEDKTLDNTHRPKKDRSGPTRIMRIKPRNRHF